MNVPFPRQVFPPAPPPTGELPEGDSPRPWLRGLGAAGALAAVAALDYLTRYQVEFFVFYAVVVAWSTWRMGPRVGVLISLTAAVLWYALDLRLSPPDTHWAFAAWGACMKCLAYLLMVWGTARFRSLLQAERSVSRQLGDALAEVRILKDLLPICAWCKRVRDDDGYWSQIEFYISARTRTTFTHSICPTCRERLAQEPQVSDPEAPRRT